MIELVPILGVSIPLVAVFGKMVVQPVLQYLERGRSSAEQVALERRVALLEQTIEGMDHSVRRLEEEADFQRQLQAPRPSGAGPSSA